MALVTNRGIPLSSVDPQYLQANATSHTWPFSAIAELIDNAYDPDVDAKQLWINKKIIKDQDCLIFMDNGNGMDYDKLYNMLSFGFSNKQTVKGHVAIGRYGNGFKSGSMRVGKDAIVFSRKADTMCVGLLSQTYLKKTEAQNVIVPIVMFTLNTRQTFSVAPEHAESLTDILTHSLFNTEEELLSEFNNIDGLGTKSSGTRIIIWNLQRGSSRELELDFLKKDKDIWIADEVYKTFREPTKRQSQAAISVPESVYSLRAYCSILYLKPRMEIILQGEKVETQSFTTTLGKVRTYTYKPVGLKKKITVTFGYNKKSKERYGLMMYHHNRLIKAYEPVACQLENNQTGEGVIGVIECNYLTPIHNKQDFDKTREYSNTLRNLNDKLKQYWNDFGHSYKGHNPVEDTVEQSEQSWVECNDCFKWRKLDGVDVEELPEKWLCSMNPDPNFKSCTVEQDCDEQPKHKKTNIKCKRDQTQGKTNRQQRSFNPSSSSSNQIIQSSTQMISSTTHESSKHSADTQDTSLSILPSRIKRAPDPNQELQLDNKKAKRQGYINSPSTSTASPGTWQLCNSGNNDKKAKTETYEIETKDDCYAADISTMPKEQIGIIKQLDHTHMEKENAENELRNKVDSLENEKSALLTSCESLRKELEKTKREGEKLKLRAEDREVQTDLPICLHEESAASPAVASTPGGGTDFGTQQHETHQILRDLRQKVARLLVTYVPALDLQQVNYDCSVIDEILTQVVNELSPAENAST